MTLTGRSDIIHHRCSWLTINRTSTLSVVGNGTSLLSLTGSSQLLNQALLSLAYTPTADYVGADLITVHVLDTAFGQPLICPLKCRWGTLRRS